MNDLRDDITDVSAKAKTLIDFLILTNNYPEATPPPTHKEMIALYPQMLMLFDSSVRQ